MFVKKQVFMVLLLLTFMVSIASAKDFSNDDRWYWAYSNNDYSGYIDKQTLKYDPQTDTAEVFVRWERPAEQITQIYHNKFFYKDNTMISYEFTQYAYGSDSGTVYINNNPISYTPIPGSGDEKVMTTVAELVGRTAQLQKIADDKKNQELEKSKEQAKDRAAKKQKESVDQGISILESIFR